VVDAGIAWEAHIGGFLAGLLLLPALDRVPDEPDSEPPA
jgi:membrane associated rhomboid family serine protease